MNILSKILLCSTIAFTFAATPTSALASTDLTVEQSNESVVIYDEEITVVPLYSLPSDLKMPVVRDSLIQSPRLLGIPAINNFKLLALNEKHPFKGVAQNSALYSEQNTKGVNSATIEITNYLSKGRVAYLYKNNGKSSDTLIATFKPAANTTMGWGVSGLSSDACYYMKFPAPSNFEGFIWRTK